MTSRRRPEDRGVSTTLSYVLTLAITTVLISGLLIGTGAVVDDRRESVARDELRVIGQHVSARLMAADRLAATDPATLRVEGEFPSRVAGSTYTVTINDSADPSRLRLSTAEVPVTIEVTYATRRSVVETTVLGGHLEITLTGAGNLEVVKQ